MNDEQEKKEGDGLTRRRFLKGTGVAAAATAVGAPATQALASAPQPRPAGTTMGPGPVNLTLQVNGRKMTTSVEPRVTLLDALRNYLDVTGCKRVCDRGTCGACTILLDGKPVYACSILALEAAGKPIQTAESLVNKNQLDRIPAAFAEHDAQQCGFCTPGFVVAMKAVFNENRNPTAQQVEEGLGGNICRCGTYEQMRQAITALCGKGGN